MTLEQLVPTLDLCQQLKAAGFPQDTVFSWAKAKDDWGKEHWHLVPTYLAIESDADRRWNDRMVKYSDGVAAPTVGELEEWLMCHDIDDIHIANETADGENAVGMICVHSDGRDFEAHEATLVSALAALVLEVAG